MNTRKMKDSGVEWLGAVPEGWKILPSRTLFSEVKQKNDDGNETRQFSFRYGQIVDKDKSGRSDVTTEETITAYRVVTPDTIMINGLNLNYDFISQRVAIVKERGIITSAYLALAPKKDLIEPSYALYLFKGYDSKQVFHGHGSGIRKTLNYSDFAEIKSVLPPLPEQRAIAAYLDKRCAKIDAMVADAKKLIEEYKAWKASLIFEAVTGKVGVDGRCRCRKMRDSGVDWIGQVPEGWVFYPIKRFFSFFKGLNITKADLTESGIPVVSYGQIHAKNNTGTHLQDELLRHVPQHYMESCPESRLKENDFVFADTSEDLEGLGNCAFVDRSDAVMAGYHTIVLRPVKNAHFKYLAYLFRADCWRRQMREIAFGIKVYSLSQRMLRQCSLVLPPLPEQRAIAAYLDRKCAAIDRVVAVKEGLIGDLEAYKKSLIFECVTGKREVA